MTEQQLAKVRYVRKIAEDLSKYIHEVYNDMPTMPSASKVKFENVVIHADLARDACNEIVLDHKAGII